MYVYISMQVLQGVGKKTWKDKGSIMYKGNEKVHILSSILRKFYFAFPLRNLKRAYFMGNAKCCYECCTV